MKPSTKAKAEYLAGMFADILTRLDNVGSLKPRNKIGGKNASTQPGVISANQ